jgi:hypothetical protein
MRKNLHPLLLGEQRSVHSGQKQQSRLSGISGLHGLNEEGATFTQTKGKSLGFLQAALGLLEALFCQLRRVLKNLGAPGLGLARHR